MAKSISIAEERILPVAEWFAENAYIAPGAHRLLTAFGLMSGLVMGREMMDILVGRDRHGHESTKEGLAPPLQPFHGIFAYNKYEDSPNAKWHKVMDNGAPVVLGAIGAMLGSSYFFKNLHGVAGKLNAELELGKGGFFLQQADYLSSMVQSKYYNRLGGLDFTLGSATGAHIFPNPLSTSTNAVRFQLGAGKKPMLPGLFGITGNRGAQSMNLYQSLLDMIGWAENNVAHYGGTNWVRDNNAIFKKAKNALQCFKDVTPEQMTEFEAYIEQSVGELEKVAQKVSAEHDGAVGDALLKHLKRDTQFTGILQDRFWKEGLEKEFVKLGLLDPANPHSEKILYGDNGLLTGFGKWLGGSAEQKEISRYYENAVQCRHGITPEKAALNPKKIPLFNDHTLLAPFAFGIGSVGLLAALGSREKAVELGADDKEAVRDLPRHEAAATIHAQEDAQRPHTILGMVNGAPLDAMSWLSSVFVVPPSLHRFMNAACLSGFLYGGMQVSNALAGKGLRGNPLAKEDIFAPLRPLYKQMDYVWKSQKTPDRWKYAAHQLIPVAFGAVGTYSGSRLYFQDRIIKADKAEFLEDYTDKIALDESESFARSSAVTSILNTGSGFHLLPFVSYSSNLQNRFLMARGQQVATPGLGNWWSGNPSKYPYHVRKLLDVMITYGTENPSEFPREFDPMAHALIAKLYPDMPPKELQAKTDAFVDAIYAVRDHYWQEGGVPEDRKDACKKDLQAHFTKAGLERTLLSIGLDPLEANLDHNGAGGSLAKWMGQSGVIARDIEAYRSKAANRLKNYPAAVPEKPETPRTLDIPDTEVEQVVAQARLKAAPAAALQTA